MTDNNQDFNTIVYVRCIQMYKRNVIPQRSISVTPCEIQCSPPFSLNDNLFTCLMWLNKCNCSFNSIYLSLKQTSNWNCQSQPFSDYFSILFSLFSTKCKAFFHGSKCCSHWKFGMKIAENMNSKYLSVFPIFRMNLMLLHSHL